MYEQPDGTVKRGAASSGGSSVVSGGPHQKALVSQQEPRGNKGWHCGSRAVCWELVGQWRRCSGRSPPRSEPARLRGARHPRPGCGALAPPHGALLHSGRPPLGPPGLHLEAGPVLRPAAMAVPWPALQLPTPWRGRMRPWRGCEGRGPAGLRVPVRGEPRLRPFLACRGRPRHKPCPGTKAGLPGCAAAQVLPGTDTRAFLGTAKSFCALPRSDLLTGSYTFNEAHFPLR